MEFRLQLSTCKIWYTFSTRLPTQSTFLSHLSSSTVSELTTGAGGASFHKITYAKIFYISRSTINYPQFHLILHKFSRSSKNRLRTLATTSEIKWQIWGIKVLDVRALIPRLSLYMIVTRMQKMVEKIKLTCRRRRPRSEQTDVWTTSGMNTFPPSSYVCFPSSS